MIEAAYVLPVILAVMLFVVEIVSYSMNSFAANDALTSIHSAILSEVSDVSNLAQGDTLDPAPLYAKCNGSDQVELIATSNVSMTTLVKGVLEAKGVSFNTSQPISVSISESSISGFKVYVINFTAVANSLVLPDVFEEFLTIDVDTVVSIKDACTL